MKEMRQQMVNRFNQMLEKISRRYWSNFSDRSFISIPWRITQSQRYRRL